jgi:hypothetical protein
MLVSSGSFLRLALFFLPKSVVVLYYIFFYDPGQLKNTEKNTKKYENSVDKAVPKIQKNRRDEVAINVTG